ncbi:AAA family ATPase [Bradyrhizobium sp. HKCCYLS1011]|uniref:bifunctional aminoglycoside phosphotransferase/ATP-binding protein n=1 Tax=Bradyrhizobium sp. HKCCYLS1011 TaxID=3420733 RepID=UPI003EBF5B66
MNSTTPSSSPETSTQDAVFAFLSDPAHHRQVRRIDTHAASVFLEGNRALKIKRAVRFPFLDYSTLEKRKAACEDELRINKPFAPKIYHRVVAVVRMDDGTLSIDGPGTPLEYAVDMTRFDESRTFDHLAARGEVTAVLAERMADTIASSHEVAEPRPSAPWIGSIERIIQAFIAAFKAGPWFASDEIEQLAEASQSTFARVKSTLEERGRQAYVRRCHGDLHLANIVLIGERPVLFDAIEFDERIASIDVIYDLAFPMMDLLYYDQQTAANHLLNRYLAITPVDNLDGLAALPLFMSMRSAIRAQVLIARLDRAGSDQTGVVEAATRYFQLARRLIQPAAPLLVAVGGLSGTGKSVLARAIAPSIRPSPGAIVLRSDVLRKQLFGVRETDRLPPDAYNADAGRKVYELLLEHAGRVLSRGYSVVVDAVFARGDERTAVTHLARKMKIPFAGFFLTADLAIRQARIGTRKADASDATPEIAGLQEGYDIGPIDWAVIDASGSTEATLAQCQTQLPR